MKTIFFILLTLFVLNTNASIKDEVSLEPITTTSNTTTSMWINVNLPSYENAMLAINIDIQFPDEFIVGTTAQDYGDGCKWDYDFNEPGTASNFSATITKKTDNGTYYRCIIYANKTTTPFHGVSGHLFQLKVKTPVTEGVYPVKVLASTYATKSDNDKENLKWNTAQTSYIVVGTPSNTTLAVEGMLPSFVTSALNSETAITNLDFSAATQINGELKLGDNKGITAVGENVTAENVSYKRTPAEGKENNWATFCLPFEVSAEGAYQITDATNGKLIVATIDEEKVAAATPFLKKGGIDVTAENTVLTAAPANAKNNLQGGYTQTNVTTENTYYLSNNTFYGINNNFNVASYHAYITGISAGARLSIEDTETNVESINANQTETIYSVTGSKLNKVQKGVNIVNGNKVLVK